MTKFPVDAPKRKVIRTLEVLGFRVVREREHISMVRENPDGTNTPLTLPNHDRLKGSTLRTVCTPSWDIARRLSRRLREVVATPNSQANGVRALRLHCLRHRQTVENITHDSGSSPKLPTRGFVRFA
jgi:HicA toxin of bacterial toxin-antitoxin,